MRALADASDTQTHTTCAFVRHYAASEQSETGAPSLAARRAKQRAIRNWSCGLRIPQTLVGACRRQVGADRRPNSDYVIDMKTSLKMESKTDTATHTQRDRTQARRDGTKTAIRLYDDDDATAASDVADGLITNSRPLSREMPHKCRVAIVAKCQPLY